MTGENANSRSVLQASSRPDTLPLMLYVAPMVGLLAALGPWPYGYYVLLRIVVCLASAVVAWRIGRGAPILFWAFIGLAILYNPVVKVPLARLIWSVINLISLAPFLVVAARELRRRSGLR